MVKKNIIGVIPQYPEHSRLSVFKAVRIPQVGLVSVLSNLPREEFDMYAIGENNYGYNDNEFRS